MHALTISMIFSWFRKPPMKTAEWKTMLYDMLELQKKVFSEFPLEFCFEVRIIKDNFVMRKLCMPVHIPFLYSMTYQYSIVWLHDGVMISIKQKW